MNHERLARLIDTTRWKHIGTDVDYAIHDGDELVILFKGSDSREDWQANFAFLRTPYRDMPIPFKVHRGFISRYKEVRDLMLSTAYVDKPVIVAGHSHGGALALLCYEDIMFNLDVDVRCVTFGCPRVFSWEARATGRFDRVTMYRNLFDIVTYIPFLIMGYRHPVKNTLAGINFQHDIKAYEREL